jgi:hypothetical protein
VSNRFGFDTIIVGEVQHAWDQGTYHALGFYVSQEAYVSPTLNGADASERPDVDEEGEGTESVLAGIRAGDPSVPVTDEELAASTEAIDAIYAAAEADKEEEIITEPHLEPEVRIASEIGKPPTVEDTDDVN